MALGTTVVDICNSALVKIGGATITSLADATKEAQICNLQFGKLRDQVLEAYPWKFARSRASLALLVTPPAFGYANAFQLPADCLNPLKIEDNDIEYKIEGRKLLTDDRAVNLEYTSQVVDPSLYTPGFAESLACRLAAELAYAISNNATLAQTMMAAYKATLSESRSINAKQGTSDPLSVGTWVNSRL
jgi:hypothetical protein